MKNFKFKINGNNYEVNIISVEGNIAEVEVNGSLYKVEVDKELQPVKTPKLVRSVAVPSTDTPNDTPVVVPKQTAGGHNVLSPLPGVILDVLVKVGDTVALGQKLLVLEAMKMENNIDSDKAGTISEIKAHKGDSVMQGDILIVIS